MQILQHALKQSLHLSYEHPRLKQKVTETKWLFVQNIFIIRSFHVAYMKDNSFFGNQPCHG